tara:strand:+ start:488 stop:2341 length:1854 start_codon:yes stop_codon:yes gene_type:complete
MAYKFQSGLARLDGTLALDTATDELLVSGSTTLASLSLENLAITGALGATSLQAAKIGINADPDLLELADGALTVNGTIEASTSLTIGGAALTEAELEKLDGITNGTVAANKAVVVDASLDASGFRNVSATGELSGATLAIAGDGLTVSDAGAVVAGGSVTAGSSFIIGSADLNETDMEKLDGITDGTVAANKAVVVDGNKDASSFRNLTATGAVTAGSFVIGSADMSEADLEKLDGITNGTVAANKAVVVDASADASGFRNISATGNVSGSGNATFLGNAAIDGTITALGSVTAGSFVIGSADMSEADLEKLDGITNGTAAASKAVVLDSNKDIAGIRNLSIVGDLEVQGTINKVTTNQTELEIEDVKILIGSGSTAAQLSDGGGGIFFGGGLADDNPAAPHFADISFNDAAEDELLFSFSGSEAMKIDAGGDLTIQGDLGVPLGSLTTTQTASAGRLAGSTLQYSGILSCGSGSGAQSASGVATGVLNSVGSGSIGGRDIPNEMLFGGVAGPLVDGLIGPMFTGSLDSAHPSSFVTVAMTGSEVVKLKLPELAVGDAGFVMTVKKQGLTSAQLVLTGAFAPHNTLLIDGVLTELTLSSPMAAVNLLWNGGGWNIY